MTAKVGQYCSGGNFVLSPVTLPKIDPPCVIVVEEDNRSGTGAPVNTVHHGCELNPGISGSAQKQSFTSANHTGPSLTYDPAANVDPGPAGKNAPLVFAAGQEGSLVKAVTMTQAERRARADGGAQYINDGRPLLSHSAVLTVVAQEPPKNAFRPGVSAPSKISKWVQDDLNMGLLKNLPPPPSVTDEFIDTAIERIKHFQYAQSNGEPNGERFRPAANTHEAYNSYGRAPNFTTAALLVHLDIGDARKLKLTTLLSQHGIDHYEFVVRGGTFGSLAQGLGGVFPGGKLPLVFAAVMLNDAGMKEWANRQLHNLFAEDLQMFYVAQTHVTNNGYLPGDIGMPEWSEKSMFRGTPAPSRTNWGGYRQIHTGWQPGTVMACHLLPGAREIWNNQVVFDYADRMMERYQFPGNQGTYQWARSTSARLPIFHREMWSAFRASHGPQIWNY